MSKRHVALHVAGGVRTMGDIFRIGSDRKLLGDGQLEVFADTKRRVSICKSLKIIVSMMLLKIILSTIRGNMFQSAERALLTHRSVNHGEP